MRGLISGKKLSFFCVLLSVMVLLSIIGANADMPMPQPVIYKVEIQGAHKVSEGGNLWFYMVNHDNQSFDVTVQYQGGVRCFNHSAIIENSYWQLNPFVLPENASANIFFQALNVSGQKVSNEFLFLITPHVHPPENSSYQVHTDRVDFFTVIEPLEDQSPFPPIAFQITAILLIVSWIAFVYLGLKRRKQTVPESNGITAMARFRENHNMN